MATILDRSRHFAINYGFIENGAAYVQDGRNFGADGIEVVADVAVEAETVVEEDAPETVFEEDAPETVFEEVKVEILKKKVKPVKKIITTADLV